MGRVNRFGRLAIPVAVLSLAAVGATAATATATARSATPAAVTSFTTVGTLNGVAVISADDAWAVGTHWTAETSSPGYTLILHWNGTKWSPVTSPKPVLGDLNSVVAVSADNVWAVGYITPPPSQGYAKTLIMHWNGKTWSRQASAPVLNGELDSVAFSGSTAWAVGQVNGLSEAPIVLHWTGNHWYVIPSEAPVDSSLIAVAETRAGTAWAVGEVYHPSTYTSDPLLLRWNGTVWKSVSSPLHANGDSFSALAADPAGQVWALGYLSSGATVSMLWNGKTWRTVPIAHDDLTDVTYAPGGTALATGAGASVSGVAAGILLRWTGNAWKQIASGGPATGPTAVAATSPGNVWMVGSYYPPTSPGTFEHPDTVILHWNGRTMS